MNTISYSVEREPRGRDNEFMNISIFMLINGPDVAGNMCRIRLGSCIGDGFMHNYTDGLAVPFDQLILLCEVPKQFRPLLTQMFDEKFPTLCRDKIGLRDRPMPIGPRVEDDNPHGWITDKNGHLPSTFPKHNGPNGPKW